MFERKGIIGYRTGKENYDILGEDTNFRNIVNKFTVGIVEQGKWIGFCTRVNDAQIDLMGITNKDGTKLGRMVLDALDGEAYKTTIYRYLLHDYMCYCEIPSVRRDANSGGFKDSYEKNLVTSNIKIVALWLGIPLEEAKMKYGSRIDTCDIFDDNTGLYPYVKLTIDREGVKKVSKPRKDIDLTTKGIRIVPLFALKTAVDLLYRKASEDFYKVTFVKDSGQVRDIDTCFNYDKILEVYKDAGAILPYYEEQYKDDFLNSQTLSRGYIRVIEIGTSIINHPTRSINFARILKFEKTEPDLTYIDVNLDTVRSTFLNKLSYYTDWEELSSVLELMSVGFTHLYNGKPITSYNMLESWVVQQEMLLSTPFIKQLYLVMKANPQIFGDIGLKETDVKEEEISYDDFDFSDLEFE